MTKLQQFLIDELNLYHQVDNPNFEDILYDAFKTKYFDKQEEEIEELKFEIDKMKTDIEELETTIEDNEETIDDLEDTISDLNFELNN